MTRHLYIYRLDITWPQGAVWSYSGRRRFLTKDGAHHAAAVLREHGAQVEIVRSRPVEW